MKKLKKKELKEIKGGTGTIQNRKGYKSNTTTGVENSSVMGPAIE